MFDFTSVLVVYSSMLTLIKDELIVYKQIIFNEYTMYIKYQYPLDLYSGCAHMHIAQWATACSNHLVYLIV